MKTYVKIENIAPVLDGKADGLEGGKVKRLMGSGSVGTLDGEREFKALITTVEKDSYNEVVIPTGADLSRYNRNPVVLLNHNYSELPIGKCTEINVTDKGLEAFGFIAKSQKCDEIWSLMKQDIIRAWSIGYYPIEAATRPGKYGYGWTEQVDWEKTKKMLMSKYGIDADALGVDIITTKWHMLEFSLTPVPSNPGTLSTGIGKSFDGELKPDKIFAPQTPNIVVELKQRALETKPPVIITRKDASSIRQTVEKMRLGRLD